MKELKTILAEEFPELEVDIPSVYGNSDISEGEISKALKYIRDNKLVQDSSSLLMGTQPMRRSVTYPIIFPNQVKALNFEVRWVQGPMVLIGSICNLDHLGRDVEQVRLYGMSVR